MQDAVDDALGLAASAKDVAGPVTISIKQIVEKTKAIADFIDEAAKVSISAGLMGVVYLNSHYYCSFTRMSMPRGKPSLRRIACVVPFM